MKCGSSMCCANEMIGRLRDNGVCGDGGGCQLSRGVEIIATQQVFLRYGVSEWVRRVYMARYMIRLARRPMVSEARFALSDSVNRVDAIEVIPRGDLPPTAEMGSDDRNPQL